MSRILHIGKYYPPFAGGIEHFMADLLPTQQQLGHTVAALVHDHQTQLSRFFAPVTPETTPDIQQPTLYRVPSYGRVVYAPLSPQFPWWLWRVVRDWRPDILHLHLPNTSAFWALGLQQVRKLPWVVHWHSDVVSNAASLDQRLNRLYPLYRPFEQALLRHAQAVVVTSPPYLESSAALQPWLAKCHVVPLGLAPSRLPAITDPTLLAWAAQQWRPGSLRVLCVGRLTYYKGQATLLQAVAQLPAAHLYLVGTGEQAAALTQLIDSLNLGARVTLAGYCEAQQLHALLHSCDCLCLPSLERTEAFGMVLLEAMRYAKPVVASAVLGSGMTWVVQQGKTGFLVPPQDAVSLGRALTILQTHERLRTQLGHAGAQRFAQTFAIMPVAQALQPIYHGLSTPT